MLNMGFYENILSTLWYDSFTVYRDIKSVDEITGETSVESQPIVLTSKCRISYSSTDTPKQDNDTANEIDHQLSIITFYDLDVMAGDQVEAIRMDRDGITALATYTGIVNESNLYRGHKQLLLSNVKYVTVNK